jgi:hypothetical protein
VFDSASVRKLTACVSPPELLDEEELLEEELLEDELLDEELLEEEELLDEELLEEEELLEAAPLSPPPPPPQATSASDITQADRKSPRTLLRPTANFMMTPFGIDLAQPTRDMTCTQGNLARMLCQRTGV